MPPATDPQQLAKTFVQTVVRMFYETEHIVVVDALVFHCALALPDLVIILDAGKSSKTVSKLCGKLKEGGLISVYVSRHQSRRAVLTDAATRGRSSVKAP
jgi:transcription initiation factor TFIIE subunit alpha